MVAVSLGRYRQYRTSREEISCYQKLSILIRLPLAARTHPQADHLVVRVDAAAPTFASEVVVLAG